MTLLRYRNNKKYLEKRYSAIWYNNTPLPLRTILELDFVLHQFDFTKAKRQITAIISFLVPLQIFWILQFLQLTTATEQTYLLSYWKNLVRKIKEINLAERFKKTW